MQTKKEEIRKDILWAATHEFAKNGYRKASLRTIAAKANTTLGNLYNYFSNKEAILDEIVKDVPEKLASPQDASLDFLLSDPFIILLEGCEGTKYQEYRDQEIQCFLLTVTEHMQTSSSALPKLIVTGFFVSLLRIAKSHKTKAEKIKELSEYIAAVSFLTEDCPAGEQK